MLLPAVLRAAPTPYLGHSPPPLPPLLPRARLSLLEDDTDYYSLRFDGLRRLYGPEAPERLRGARVVVVGVGGVGSWAVEALARSGVGALVLVDLDEVCISNTNRQLHALSDTVGRSKAAVCAQRVALINPDCEVTVREEWLTTAGARAMMEEEAALCEEGAQFAVLDAIDGYLEKAALIDACVASPALAHAHLVTVGAAGGKSDPTLIRAGDLATATNDNLLKRVRQKLRKERGYPAGQLHPARAWGVPAVFSIETALTPSRDGDGFCDRFGTACFATGSFGFAAAASLTASIAQGDPPPRLQMDRNADRNADGNADGNADSNADGNAERQPAKQRDSAAPREDRGARGVAGSRRGSAPKMCALAVEGRGGEGRGGEGRGGACALFDSHCHALREAEQILETAGTAGACFVSTGEAEWEIAVPSTSSPGDTWRYGLGVHPWFVGEQRAGWIDRLRAQLEASPAAAVGEAGLDRARRHISTWQIQLRVFSEQLALAAELRRALVVHCVRADGALLGLLKASTPLPPVLVLHAYGGSVESAAAFLRLPTRVYFGFSPSAARLRRAAAVLAALPADRILLESDEEDATRALSGVREACSLVACARGWDESTASRITAGNARAAFDASKWAS